MTGISARRHCRFGRRDDAKEELKEAQEKGDQEAVERFSKRTVKVTKQHTDDCKKLLTLMGVPYVEVRMAQKHDALITCRCGHADASGSALHRWYGTQLQRLLYRAN
jgi:flap endonuclease-1